MKTRNTNNSLNWVQSLGGLSEFLNVKGIELSGLLFEHSVKAVCVLSCFSCVQLFTTPDWSLPGSSVQRILLDPGIEPTSVTSPALAAGVFTTGATWEACMDSL